LLKVFVVQRSLAYFISFVLTAVFAVGQVLAEEVSPGGSSIKRYENVVPDKGLPEHEATNVAEIEDALKPFLGENYVLHEIVSTSIHLDVLVFKPTPNRNYWTFVTSGMSDKPMTVPQEFDVDQYGYAELAIALPPSWFSLEEEGMIPQLEMENDKKFWPIALLKFLGRFPHEYQTWFWESHSMPNGNPAEPFSNDTKLSGVLLTQLHAWPEEYRQIRLKNGTVINLFGVVPVYDNEMTAKLEVGFDPVFSALASAGVTEIIDIVRPSIAHKLAN
ncbi:MAG: suppressor of fused domain protein, partial [Rhizobiaceae bacterium]